jgi:hypothetical protein
MQDLDIIDRPRAYIVFDVGNYKLVVSLKTVPKTLSRAKARH